MELDKDQRTTDAIDRLLSDLAWAREQHQANSFVDPIVQRESNESTGHDGMMLEILAT